MLNLVNLFTASNVCRFWASFVSCNFDGPSFSCPLQRFPRKLLFIGAPCTYLCLYCSVVFTAVQRRVG